jgi:GT2 family glycosyltransferase
MNNPLISILLVNHNGEEFLEDCILSIQKNTFIKNAEIIVVDNNSNDSSLKILEKYKSYIKIIKSKKNLGFADGNNLAFSKSKGDFIVLLNTDTMVEADWLENIYKPFKNKKIGITTSKLLLKQKYLSLNIKSDVVTKAEVDGSNESIPVGIIIQDLICTNKNNKITSWYDSGFYPSNDQTLNTKWCTEKSKILIPTDEKKLNFKLIIHGPPSENKIKFSFKISIGTQNIINDFIYTNSVKQYEFSTSALKYQNQVISLVQNAGSNLLLDGYSKDRGSLIKQKDNEKIEFYEEDSEYFQKNKKVLSSCGAACMIRRSIINDIDLFDGSFFMYYEDSDFSLRAWRQGWDILYVANAIVHHVHKGSSKKKANHFFTFLIEKNHMSFMITHYPLKQVLIQLLILIMRTIYFYIKYMVYSYSKNYETASKLEISFQARLDALYFLLTNRKRLRFNRSFWKEREIRSFSEAQKQMY